MTSGNFTSFPISSIIVDRDNRQRKRLTNIEELAESISRLGLIHPITITREGTLVAGERRLTACRSLGWTNIPVQFTEDLTENELRLIELEENIKRVDITWQERMVAVNAYINTTAEIDPEKSTADIAEDIGISRQHVNLVKRVAENLSDPDIANAKTFTAAKNILVRREQRARIADAETITFEESTSAIINADFIEWVNTYDGPLFNFIHCDFPYGVNLQRSGQATGYDTGNYDDRPEIFFELIDVLTGKLDRFCAPDAHLMFWFSMKFYTETVAILSPFFRVNPTPLIWVKSDNSGIIPDHNRGPRQIYETALFCTRGERLITRPVANAVVAQSTKEIHMSEKPVDMLSHFFRMIVDETSSVLDPTCGSGTALRAAHMAGAKHVFGLERNPDFARTAAGALRATMTQPQLALEV